MPDQLLSDNWAELYSRHIENWGRRFAEAFNACGADGAVILSGTEKPRFRDDGTYPFFAEPYFKAWVPLTYPNSALRILPGEAPLLIYVQGSDFWHAATPAPDGFWTSHFEIRPVPTRKAMLKELGASAPRLAAIGEDADESMGFASINDEELLGYLDFYRAFKTPYETACVEEANRISATGHVQVQTALADKPSEFELNQLFCGATGQRESELPYQNIVALNEHAGVLHYQKLDRERPAVFHSFLLDAGAHFNGYASDVTRTCSGDTGQFHALIASVDAMQRRLCAGARNGVSFVALNELAHQLLADVLEQHEIIRCTSEECYARGVTRTFLPHGLGHLLGLQVHDIGGHLDEPGGTVGLAPEEHPFLRLTRKLEPGFIVTIEPGLYFIPSLLERAKSGPMNSCINWQRVEQLLPYGGIRIEDNVLVTDTESQNLSRPALADAGVS